MLAVAVGMRLGEAGTSEAFARSPSTANGKDQSSTLLEHAQYRSTAELPVLAQIAAVSAASVLHEGQFVEGQRMAVYRSAPSLEDTVAAVETGPGDPAAVVGSDRIHSILVHPSTHIQENWEEDSLGADEAEVVVACHHLARVSVDPSSSSSECELGAFHLEALPTRSSFEIDLGAEQPRRCWKTLHLFGCSRSAHTHWVCCHSVSLVGNLP